MITKVASCEKEVRHRRQLTVVTVIVDCRLSCEIVSVRDVMASP